MINAKMRLKVISEYGIPLTFSNIFEDIDIGQIKIPAQEIKSTNYFNSEGRALSVKFIPTAEIKTILINNRLQNLHRVSNELLKIIAEIYIDTTGEIIYTGICSSIFEYDELFGVIENFKIYDSLYILIKYWLDFIKDSVIIPDPVENENEELIPYSSTYSSLLRYCIDVLAFKEQFGFSVSEKYIQQIQATGIPVVNELLRNFQNIMGGITTTVITPQSNLIFYDRKIMFYTYADSFSNFKLVIGYYQFITAEEQDPETGSVAIRNEETLSFGNYLITTGGQITELSSTRLQKSYPFSSNNGAILYNLLTTNGERLFDTDYINRGFQDLNTGYIFNKFGNVFTFIPEPTNENSNYWECYFTGTLFFDNIEVNGGVSNSNLLKGLCLINNVGLYSSGNGNVVIDNKINPDSLNTTVVINKETSRSKYLPNIIGDYEDSWLNVFYNKESISLSVKEFYKNLFKTKFEKEFIITNSSINVGDKLVDSDSKLYFITYVDKYTLYPFVIVRGYGG